MTVLNLGFKTSQLCLLSDAAQHSILSQAHSVREIEAFIPRKLGAKDGVQHTLVFHRSGFRIKKEESQKRVKTEEKSEVLDLRVAGEEGEEVVMSLPLSMNGRQWQVRYVRGNPETTLKSIAKPSLPLEMQKFIEGATAGELRSLLQKIIRFAGSAVVMAAPSGEVHAATHDVLQAVMLRFVVHAGGFVPQLQTFVRGLPSFLKRLAVIIVEDAWIPEGCDRALHDLLLAAVVSEQDPEFFPSAALLQRWFQWAHAALQSDKAVVYDCQRAGAALPDDDSLLQRASAFLDHLRSFPWDLIMLRDVAVHQENLQFVRSVSGAREVMRMEHFLDHHITPHLVYYLSPWALAQAKQQYDPREIFGDFSDDREGSQPYASIMRAIFRRVSGFNYRRSKGEPFAVEDPFVKIVRQGQEDLWAVRNLPAPEEEEEEKETPELQHVVYHQDVMCLAAEAGYVTVRCGHLSYYGFLENVHANGKVDVGVVRVPSLGQKDTALDQSDAEKVREATVKRWREGFKIRGKNIFLNEVGQLSLKDGGNVQEFLRLSTLVSRPEYARVQQMFRESLFSAAQRRLWQLSSNFTNLVEFPKITRNGGPEDKAITTVDVEVFQFLRNLLPCSFLVLAGEREFRVTNSCLWWHLRETFLKKTMEYHQNPCHSSSEWSFFPDRQERTPTPEQEDALHVLTKRGQRANMLVMPPGSGKTRVIMEFLRFLQSRSQLPKYVVYALPPRSTVFSRRSNALRRMCIGLMRARMPKITKAARRVCSLLASCSWTWTICVWWKMAGTLTSTRRFSLPMSFIWRWINSRNVRAWCTSCVLAARALSSFPARQRATTTTDN